MKNIVTIGLDVGNYDTKTQTTTTTSGFSKYQKLPFSVDEYVLWKGCYYIVDGTRFSYVKDKTKSDNLFILSLLGIGKEILSIATKAHRMKEMAAEKNADKTKTITDIQNEISKITTINLGIGLPPTHMSTLREVTINYYKEKFGEGISFEYQKYKFNLKLNYINCYPQDYAALIAFDRKNENNKNHVINKFNSYYAIDIGGWTLDIITMINGKVNMTKCDSKPLGVLAMYESIINNVETQTDIRLTQEVLEDILRGKPTLLDENDECINLINSLVESWFDSIINALTQFGVEFATRPLVFIGGGSLLFKPYIEKSKVIRKYDFISGVNANAIAYCALASQGL